MTLVVVAISAIGGYAYFTNTGTGTGNNGLAVGTVPPTGSWNVQFATNAAGVAISTSYSPNTATALLPTDINSANKVVATVPFTIQNLSEASEHLVTWTASLTGFLAGCSAADFSVGGEAVGVAHTVSGLDVNLAPASDGATSKYTTSVTVQMINNPNADQSGCETQTPTLTVTASS